jgi:carboxylesterase
MSKKPPIYQHPELDGESFTIQGTKYPGTALLFIHGFTATTVEVKVIANFFHKKGFTVSGPLLPGHGLSPKDLNRKNWKDWVKAVDDSYIKLKKTYNTVYVFGESMGALLALWLAVNHNEIRKIFLFSPALVINGLWSSKILWPFKESIIKKNIDDSMAWQGYNVVPLRAAASLYDFQQIIKRMLPTIKTDTSIFQGKQDSTINLMSPQMVYEGLNSRRKTITWLEESRHCILLDKQIDLVQEQCFSELINDFSLNQ